MGNSLPQEAHVKRSSGMSFATSWKHEHIRLISAVSLISLAMTCVMIMMLYGSTSKTVKLIVNGEEKIVQTNQWNVQRMLDEHEISVGIHDRISEPMLASLQDGSTIVVDHAIPVVISADGETAVHYTLSKQVGEVLDDFDIELGEYDKISDPLDAPIVAGMNLQVTRVKKERELESHVIAYDVVKQTDANLLKGKEQVVQEGQEGLLVKTIEHVYENGQLIASQIVDEAVQQETVNQIVAVGTKNPVTVLSLSSPAVEEVTLDDVTFEAKQVLNNVTLTAYSADFASTGKTKDDPLYGVTYSGAKVMEGRTIAVDPKVIPLGWWVYIEGLGFRRAEDIGSAIKGNKIDVYFDSESYANKFGRKRGYTVYVIGPKKPTMD